MTEYPLDIDATQIVHWLLDAERSAGEGLVVTATRQYLAQPLAQSVKPRIGEEEAEDLDVVAAIGILEIRPRKSSDDWLIRVRVDDELGPRLPEDESVWPEEEEIDLAAFNADFIVPDRGTFDVVAQVSGESAKRRVDRLIAKIRQDRHAGQR